MHDGFLSLLILDQFPGRIPRSETFTFPGKEEASSLAGVTFLGIWV